MRWRTPHRDHSGAPRGECRLHGRRRRWLTGKAGVALVTSGPGCANLITGLATATSEGDAMVALGGAVRRADGLKLTHQSLDTVSLCR